jgi:hypothetical protein
MLAGPAIPCSALLRVGFAEPPRSPGALVRSYRTVSPLPDPFGSGFPETTRPSAVCFLWHFPASRPDWLLASTLPCGAPTFLDTIAVVPRPPGRGSVHRALAGIRIGGHPSVRPTWGHRPGRPSPIRPCSGWGLPSRPGHPERWCALTAPFHPYLCPKAIGGLFSVALSFGSPRLAVSQHPALRSPDLPRHDRSRAAVTRPALFTGPLRDTGLVTIHLCGPPGDVGRAGHPLFGLAPGGVCRAAPVTRDAGALLPHRFTLT